VVIPATTATATVRMPKIERRNPLSRETPPPFWFV
jgi:hypothetical protein